MGIGMSIAVYLFAWWIVFLAILPIGAEPHELHDPTLPRGADPGSPRHTYLGRKAIGTTIITAILVGTFAWLI